MLRSFWWFALVACGETQIPAAFDWSMGELRVAAVRTWPAVADATVPRQVEALVLPPGARASMSVELCGFDPEQPVALTDDVRDVRCFEAESLVEVVDDAVPGRWQVERYEPHPDRCSTYGVDFLFPRQDENGFPGKPDEREYPPVECGTNPLLRVVADDGRARATALGRAGITGVPYDPRHAADPSTADPVLEVVDGELEAGGRVLLRFSVVEAWVMDTGVWAEPFVDHQWYVSAGMPWGSGITRTAGFADGRVYAQTWLTIPDDHVGPLHVATVRRDMLPTWAVTTLEVP